VHYERYERKPKRCSGRKDGKEDDHSDVSPDRSGIDEIADCENEKRHCGKHNDICPKQRDGLSKRAVDNQSSRHRNCKCTPRAVSWRESRLGRYGSRGVAQKYAEANGQK
jgi:hypothetical protein